MQIIDYLFLYSLITIWALLFMNIILTYNGYKFSLEMRDLRLNVLTGLKEFPRVTILIPAHNEEVVIKHTVLAMVNLNYPSDSLEIIVVNDNSKDNTGEIVEKIRKKYPDKNIKLLNIIGEVGGKGKSNALNIGLKEATGEFIAVYDADNTPNSLALRYLVYELTTHEDYGAVIGKFRTRNKTKNILTRFINIETLSFQWMAQAGRWRLLNLCTIPGTNFIIRKSILEKMGGWDIKAVAEDTEISFRIYQMGYKISFMPLAVTYEQEPETLKVWFKQRTRWVNGNIYVLSKFIFKAFKEKSKEVLFDLYYFFSVYLLFLSSVIISDVIFLLGIFTGYKVQIGGNFFVIWLLTYIVFILQIGIALSIERGEIHNKNIILICIMYFTYCQLWLFVSIYGFYLNFKDRIFNKQTKWYKTERF